MLQGNVKTVDVIVKKMGEESKRATELALEGQSLFTSGRKHTIKPGQQSLRNPGRDISFPIFTRKEIETKRI